MDRPLYYASIFCLGTDICGSVNMVLVSEWVDEFCTSVLTFGAETVAVIEMNLTEGNMRFINRYTDTFTVE
jgi:hypothetical protein